MPDFYPFSQLLLDLLPNGEPWNKSPGSELEKTASKIGNIFHVIDFLLDSFPGELSPETCSQGQLIKFQKEMGVPLDTSAAGRDTAVRAYTSTGIISLSELKRELKDAAGIEPVIIEYMPSRAGQLRCGQKLMGESYLFVYTISGIPMSAKVRSIIKRYRQAHVAAYFIKPDTSVERL